MKRLFFVLAATLAALSLHPVPPSAEAQAGQPNIVFIITDDQRSDMYNYMPNVKSLLTDQGTFFSHGYAGNPLCCPARASIMRGQYSHYTREYGISGTYGGAGYFRKAGLADESISVWLDRAGYRTALVGKYLNGYTGTVAFNFPTPPGWDYFRAWATSGGGYFNFDVAEGSPGVTPTKRSYTGSTSNVYSTNVYTDYATEFIGSTPSTDPLFLSLNYHAPHSPHTPDPADATAPCGAYPADDLSLGEADVSDKPMYIQNKVWTDANTTQVKNAWRQSCRQLQAVDRGVASVIASLNARDPGLTNTIIIYTSDQGLMLGSHRSQGKKNAYETSAQVPFIVRYSGTVPGGIVSPRLVTHVDMTATAVALSGAVVPETSPGSNLIPCKSPCILGPMEGQNLMPLLTDPLAPWRSSLLIEQYDAPGTSGFVPPYCAVVNDARMKYVRYDPDVEPRYEELYDLNADPWELQNLAYDPAYAEVKATMLQQLQTLCSPTPVDYGF